MDQIEVNYFLSNSKQLEDCIHSFIYNIDSRLDKLFEQNLSPPPPTNQHHDKLPNPLSSNTFLAFKAPYIRDFRNFSGPDNEDVKEIKKLPGSENIDLLLKNKRWSKESKRQLNDAVLDHYAQLHILELIKQKNILNRQIKEAPQEDANDIRQKLCLIDEQMEQVRARKQERIFVPEDRKDNNIDWCAISAKLTDSHHDATDCRLMWSNRLHWSISDGLWTKEEDDCLINAVEKYGKNDWDSVAKELNSNRLPWQCCSRYNQQFANASYISSSISETDVDKIIEVINLCRIGNFVPWNQVMYFIQYHSLLQVKYQWQKVLSERKSSQPWTRSEDALLLKAVEKLGDKDWNRISSFIPGRSNKSCRERFMMRLKFSKRAVGAWRPDEDENLLSFVDRFGTNFSLISTLFPERNAHQLRSRYELLKIDTGRVGPVKRKTIYRDSEGFLIEAGSKRQKKPSEREVDERLHEILSAYQTVKPSNKSLIYRSAQDEFIYQSLIQVLRSVIAGSELKHDLISSVIERAIKTKVGSKFELLTPCLSTLRGYKAWAKHHEYLVCQFQEDSSASTIDSITATADYHKLLKMVMSLFLWPAILSRIRKPNVATHNYQVGSIIERDTKNLYKIRELQKQLTAPNNQLI